MKKYIPFLILTAFALSGCANKEQQENLVVTDQQDPIIYKENSNGFTKPIIRETGKPEYSQIKSGVYTQDKYVVNQGDTLFFVSYISGLSAEDIIHLNHLKSPYQLKEGQVLRLHKAVQTPQAIHTAKNVTVSKDKSKGMEANIKSDDRTKSKPTKAQPTPELASEKPQHIDIIKPNAEVVKNDYKAKAVQQGYKFGWPTKGNIISTFKENVNKGIDIQGVKGQPILASERGQVVYVGNGLRGYGNLIIIKHGPDYLTAYAHNDEILVLDQQEVKKGQPIAKMGDTGTNGYKVYFEIRESGKAVDPLNYLKKR